MSPQHLVRRHAAELRRALQATVIAEQRLAQFVESEEQAERRWEARAAWVEERNDAGLAALARERAREHRRRATGMRQQYNAESARIRVLKRELRELEAGRGPPGVVPLGDDPLEARFLALQREEQLERDLANLKARMREPGAKET